jgi:spermidine synthase
MNQLIWMAVGAGIVLFVEVLYWLYWRYLGTGSIRDYINEDQEPKGKYRIIRKFKTPTQRIALVDYNGEMWIYSNGDVMFSTTVGENVYADMIVHIPMAAARKRKNVLIIGGGGGITTREALRYLDVEKITTVDIDDVMIDFGKNLDALVKFNKGSLNHPKVQTVIEDGRRFVENHSAKWDVIIIDIPEPTDQCPQLSRLFSREFYSLLKERLEPEGAITIACSTVSWMPKYFWSIQATLKKAGFHVLPYHNFVLEDGEDWGFCLATKFPVKPDDLHMLVPTRYLTRERLKDMFHMPFYLANGQNKGEIQTDNNTVLLDIVNESF